MNKLSKILSLSLVFVLLLGAASVVFAYNYPSTNDANRTRDRQHFNVLNVGEGEVTLEFVNPQKWVVCFEYRTDGDVSQALSAPNYNTAIPDMYPYLCIVGQGTTERTFAANEYIEIRSTFGAERDDDFDWTRVDVLPKPEPEVEPVVEMPVWQAGAQEVFPLVMNPESAGKAVQIYWVDPVGDAYLIGESVVSDFGDISFVVDPKDHTANADYGLFVTDNPADGEIAVWARFVAVVDGTVVQDVLVSANDGTDVSLSYLLGADTVNQTPRASTLTFWAWAE